MVKRGILIFMIALLMCVFTAGCAKSDADRITGTWDYRITDQNATVYLNYVFEKDGTGNCWSVHMKNSMQGDFEYLLGENRTLSFTYPNGIVIKGEYAFNEDYTALTLTMDGVSYKLQKAKTEKVG